MSFNYALLAELTERKRKLNLKETKNYDDAVVRRNSKFKTAKVLIPLPNVNSSKFRSVGTNTIQELLSPFLQKESNKKKMTMRDKPSYHTEFDNMSSSSEEIIYVDEDTEKHTLMSNPFQPGFGVEGIVLKKGFSWYPRYTLFIDGQFIMKAKTRTRNGARSYLLSTTKGLKPNEKADIPLGEVRATSDSYFVLYSLCTGQENRELVAIIQHKQRFNWLYIIPKAMKRNLQSSNNLYGWASEELFEWQAGGYDGVKK